MKAADKARVRQIVREELAKEREGRVIVLTGNKSPGDATMRIDRDRAARQSVAEHTHHVHVRPGGPALDVTIPSADQAPDDVRLYLDPSLSQVADRASEGEAPASDGTTTGAGHQYLFRFAELLADILDHRLVSKSVPPF